MVFMSVGVMVDCGWLKVAGKRLSLAHQSNEVRPQPRRRSTRPKQPLPGYCPVTFSRPNSLVFAPIGMLNVCCGSVPVSVVGDQVADTSVVLHSAPSVMPVTPAGWVKLVINGSEDRPSWPAGGPRLSASGPESRKGGPPRVHRQARTLVLLVLIKRSPRRNQAGTLAVTLPVDAKIGIEGEDFCACGVPGHAH